MPTTYQLLPQDSDTRLDVFITTSLPALTRSHAKKLINDGHVTVNGRSGKPAFKLKARDAVSVTVPDPEPTDLQPEVMAISIVYEDADLIVVNKPAGLTVHPGPGHASHTLVNAILAHCPDLTGINGSVRPGIVHRLDKDTSGLIMIAKNETAQLGLARQIKERTVTKKYLAVIKGAPEHRKAIIDAPIARDPHNRQRMAIVADGRHARTEYHVLRALRGHSLVEATLITGRTHQIRLHFSSIGHPILGDRMYGGGSPMLERQFLHAARLRFTQPRTGAAIDCEAPLPDALQVILQSLQYSS